MNEKSPSVVNYSVVVYKLKQFFRSKKLYIVLY